MKLLTLPDDSIKNKSLLKSDVVIYHYKSTKDSFNEKAILSRNTFSLVIHGVKTMHFAEKTVKVNDAEIHMLSAGNCIASVSIPEKRPFESLLIYFNNNVLLDFYASHATLINKFKQKPSRTDSYVAFTKDQFIRNYIESMLLALEKTGELSDQMKHLKLQELLLYLLENQTEVFLSFKLPAEITDADMRIRNVVEANADNNLTLDELAFLSSVSTSTFKRQFKKIYGTSPGEWLNEQKMILAGKMLRQKKERPGEIWSKLGFETHTGFTKSFKKHFGVSPKDYAGELALQE